MSNEDKVPPPALNMKIESDVNFSGNSGSESSAQRSFIRLTSIHTFFDAVRRLPIFLHKRTRLSPQSILIEQA
jgi:hypothetical protein